MPCRDCSTPLHVRKYSFLGQSSVQLHNSILRSLDWLRRPSHHVLPTGDRLPFPHSLFISPAPTWQCGPEPLAPTNICADTYLDTFALGCCPLPSFPYHSSPCWARELHSPVGPPVRGRLTVTAYHSEATCRKVPRPHPIQPSQLIASPPESRANPVGPFSAGNIPGSLLLLCRRQDPAAFILSATFVILPPCNLP